MAGTPIRTVCLPIFLIAFIAANVHTAEADPVETWESEKGCCREAGPGKGSDGDAHQDSVVVKMYRKVSQKKALRQCKTACIDSTDCTAIEFFRKGKKSKKMYRCELHTADINGASKRSKSCKRATCSIVTRTSSGAPPPPPQGFNTNHIALEDPDWMSVGGDVSALYNRAVVGKPITHFKAGCTDQYTAIAAGPDDGTCQMFGSPLMFDVTSGMAKMGVSSMQASPKRPGDVCDGYHTCVGEAAFSPVRAFVRGDVVFIDWSSAGSQDDFEAAAVLYEASNASATPDPATDNILTVMAVRGPQVGSCADFRDRATPMELPDFNGNLNVVGCTAAGSWRQYLSIDTNASFASGHVYVGFFSASYDATGLLGLGALVTIESIVLNQQEP